MDLQTTLYDALKLIGHYAFYLYLVFSAFAAVYGMNIRKAALNDMRNTGSGWRETSRIAHAIVVERCLKRHKPTMIFYYGIPVVGIFMALSPFLIAAYGR